MEQEPTIQDTDPTETEVNRLSTEESKPVKTKILSPVIFLRWLAVLNIPCGIWLAFDKKVVGSGGYWGYREELIFNWGIFEALVVGAILLWLLSIVFQYLKSMDDNIEKITKSINSKPQI